MSKRVRFCNSSTFLNSCDQLIEVESDLEGMRFFITEDKVEKNLPTYLSIEDAEDFIEMLKMAISHQKSAR